MGEESRAGRHEGSWLGWDTLPRPPVPGMGLMSLLQDVGPQAAAYWWHSGPSMVPSACLGPLTGSDSWDSAPAPVAAGTRWNKGEKTVITSARCHVSLLSGWFCLLIYFDLLGN